MWPHAAGGHPWRSGCRYPRTPDAMGGHADLRRAVRDPATVHARSRTTGPACASTATRRCRPGRWSHDHLSTLFARSTRERAARARSDDQLATGGLGVRRSGIPVERLTCAERGSDAGRNRHRAFVVVLGLERRTGRCRRPPVRVDRRSNASGASRRPTTSIAIRVGEDPRVAPAQGVADQDERLALPGRGQQRSQIRGRVAQRVSFARIAAASPRPVVCAGSRRGCDRVVDRGPASRGVATTRTRARPWGGPRRDSRGTAIGPRCPPAGRERRTPAPGVVRPATPRGHRFDAMSMPMASARPATMARMR